jgi:hypothetical protein
MIAIAKKLMMLITALPFSQHGGEGPSHRLTGASWQSRLNSAPPGSAVWEKWEEKHPPQHIKGRTLVSRSDLAQRLVHLRQRFVH